jgi:hypothetical protein
MAWCIECSVVDMNADIRLHGVSFSAALLLVVPVNMMLVLVLRGE